MLKKNQYAWVIWAIAFVACDKIEGPYRESNQASGIDTVKFSETVNPRRALLLEEFTGHTCGNCPRGAEIAASILNEHPDDVHVIALHVSQQFASPVTDGSGKYTYEFRTQDGNDIDETFGASNAGLPQGMVSRTTYNGKRILDRNDWNGAVAALLNQASDFDVQVKSYYNTSSDSIYAFVQCRFANSGAGNLSLALYAVEDSIVNWQKDYSKPPGQKDIQNYTHRHVFRGSFNTAFGQELINGNYEQNQKVKKGFRIKKGADWQLTHTHVLAVISNAASQEVVQVAASHIKSFN